MRATLSIVVFLIGVATSLSLSNPLIMGLAIVLSYKAFEDAERVANLKGKTDLIKVVNGLIPNLIEFSALSLTAFFSPELLVSVLVIGTIGFSESFRHQLERRVLQRSSSFIGRTERIYILALVFSASFLNVYFMFYGLIFLLTAVLSDLALTVYHILKD